MLARCAHRPSVYPGVARYAGRGIEVCEAWRRTRTLFFAWAQANGYQPGLQLDRRDNDRGYNPENCRWVPAYVNARNRATTKLTADDVREIRVQLRAAPKGRPIWPLAKRLGERFGVNPTTVDGIRSGHRWREDTL